MTVDDWWFQLWRSFRSCKYGRYFYLLYHIALVINEAELANLLIPGLQVPQLSYLMKAVKGNGSHKEMEAIRKWKRI